MKFEKFLQIFVPTDHSFYPLFESASKNLVEASILLKEMIGSSDSVSHDGIARKIKDIEHASDEITNKVYDQLNKSFITPFDREDIHELAANIDDVLDSINGISRRICLYKPKKLNTGFSELAELIYQAALLIDDAVGSLEHAGDRRKKIFSSCEKVKDIEHKADDTYYNGVSSLFEKEDDSKELIKNIRILEILERCVDEEEDVTDTIRTILIKLA